MALLCCAQSVAQLCPTLCDPLVCSLSGSLSIELSRQEYWSRVPFSPPEDILNPEIELPSLMPPNSFTAPSGKPYVFIYLFIYLFYFLPLLNISYLYLNDSEDVLKYCTGFGVNITAL